MTQATLSERALILAPRGRDAPLLAAMLSEAGIAAEICGSLSELLKLLDQGAGVAIVAEEALVSADLLPLSGWIDEQEEWSDQPFVLLTMGGGLERNPVARRYLEILGNASIVERPFHPTTLLSLVEAALRGRRRQYEARTRLASARASAARFRFLDDLAILTQPLVNPSDVMSATAAFLGQHLGVGVCAYADVEPDQDTFTIRGDWTAPGSSSIVGSYQLASFGKTAVVELRGGRPLITRDTLRELGPEQAGLFLRLGLCATVCMPLVKDGRLIALMAVHNASPRNWTADELSLVADTVTRSWAHIERVRSEANLRGSEARFRAAVAAVQGLLWTNDAQGRMTGAQPGWEALTGQTQGEYQGFGWADAVHPNDAQPTIDAWNEAVAARQTFVFEHRVRRYDGVWRTFAIRAVPVVTSTGDIREWVGVHRDITEARNAEAALRLAKITLEQRVAEEVAKLATAEEALRQSQKMEAMGQLTGGVAHDFNNLLTIIKSSSDLLRRPGLADDRRQRYIDAISETVDRASKVTGQLLAFARRQALKPEVFEVGARLTDMAELLRSIVGSGMKIAVEVPETSCYAEADVVQFETALVNMAVNARDAMDHGGSLTIRLFELNGLPSVRSRRARGGTYVAIAVSDTGIGIPPDKLAQIFEPFFTTKAIGKGTGLGLSQVFGFAQQSGGDIGVESRVGEGTTFTLYLPRVEGAPSASVAEATKDGESPVEEPGQQRRILVVEDNVDVGRSSTQLLQDLGYETTWAANAEEALDILSDERSFDAVFSDVVMPGMSGVELGHTIRERHPGLPVVLTSGYSHVLAEEGRHGFELLHKPYAVEQLSHMLQRAIARRSETLGK